MGTFRKGRSGVSAVTVVRIDCTHMQLLIPPQLLSRHSRGPQQHHAKHVTHLIALATAAPTHPRSQVVPTSGSAMTAARQLRQTTPSGALGRSARSLALSGRRCLTLTRRCGRCLAAAADPKPTVIPKLLLSSFVSRNTVFHRWKPNRQLECMWAAKLLLKHMALQNKCSEQRIREEFWVLQAHYA